MKLGVKRNLMHSKSSGDIIVYMDDDDYYPPQRVSHAVETLQKNPHALAAGSSEIYIYFKHIDEMYQFGPYRENHATAGTFALRRSLIETNKYNEDACLAEEREFLNDYTIPLVQLDPLKVILVFSHEQNTFDKRTLLYSPGNNPFQKVSDKCVEDFVVEDDLIDFYMNIDTKLVNYEPGHPKNKPDVIAQQEKMKVEREQLMSENILSHRANIISQSNNPEEEIKKFSEAEQIKLRNFMASKQSEQKIQHNLEDKALLEKIKQEQKLKGEDLELHLLKTARLNAMEAQKMHQQLQALGQNQNQQNGSINVPPQIMGQLQMMQKKIQELESEKEIMKIEIMQKDSLLDIIKSLREENDKLKSSQVVNS